VKGIASALFATAGSAHWFAVMLGVRFLFGVGEAGAYPNIARALGRWFPLRERAVAQSFIWLCSRLGGACAPAIIGGLMVLGGDWQRAFWLLGLAGGVWALGFAVWFRDRPEDVARVNAAERELIRAGEPVSGSIYDDHSGAAFRWRSLVTPNALALCAVSFCVSFCFYFYITFLPKYLKDQFEVDYAQSQWISGLPLLAGGLACLAGGYLSDSLVRRSGSKRWGRRLMPMLGWTAAGLCALAVPRLESAAAGMALIVVAFACQDFGVPSMWSVPVDIGGRYAGTLGGWMNSAGAVGGMLSPLVAAQVSIAHGWNATFVVFGGVYLAGALAWFFLDASKPLSGNARDGA
jgi:MFS family permease